MNKKTIATFAVVTILSLGTLSASSAFAQKATSGQDPMSSLAQKIAEKFGLKQADVQAVFDADRESRHSNMQAGFENQLSQLVAAGKITEAQKQLILQKRKELDAANKAQKESKQNLNPEERKAQREKMKASLEAWAKNNGIDIKYLMPHVKKGHEGFGKWHGEKPEDAPTATSTPTNTQQ